MALKHFAKIDDNNIVLRVDPLDDSIATDEAAGQAHLESTSGWPAAKWIQTDYDTKRNAHLKGGTPFRGNFAATGYEWDDANQIFWPAKGNNPTSWVKNLTTADWESPAGLLPDLDDSKKLTHYWQWDEATVQWVEKEYATPIEQAVYDAAEDKEELLGRKR
tara:strand:- start:1249 stop:1734 length:486 start_codon:yes stop_codon:yes gene_type:complete